MKKIKVILKGRKFTDKLFGLKERKIRRAIESAKDSAEKQKEDAAIAYEELFGKMADDDADYQCILCEMIKHKQTIISAEATIDAIKAIEDDLDSEVEETEE